MGVSRLPRQILRPFVASVWATDETHDARVSVSSREHVVPTGAMHLVFRLSDDPLRLFEDARDDEGRIIGTAILGGARSRFYVREVSKPLCSVGAMLHPGAAEILFGVHAAEFSERHTALEDLWGSRVASMRDRLVEAGSIERRLDAFECLLAERLPRLHGLHPAVAEALQQLRSTGNIHEVVRQSGYSHRRFIALFSQTVGLTPKLYSRVLRFQRALQRVRAPDFDTWADVAMASGYSDQSHFNREFKEFVGVTPTDYRDIASAFPHHVRVRSPLGPAGQIPSRPPGQPRGMLRAASLI
jgi:AraC-like DNA-binding protein